jgi:competence protein ComEC
VRTYAVTAILAWLASAPLILYHTGSFNPLTPVAVIVATPIASLIQITGLAGLGVSVISEPIGSVLLGGTFRLGGALAWVTRLFDAAGAHRVAPPVSAAWACAAVAGVLWFIARARLSDWRPWAALAAVVIWFGAEANASGSLDRGIAARVDMLAVGDGSCLLVRARGGPGSGSDGGSFLWDAGSLRPRMGVRTIPSSLRALGSPRVRTAIVTHANIDHYNALPDAARAIGLERVLVSAPALASMRASREGSAERRFLAQMDALGVTVEPIARGDTRRIGDATLRVLWPPEEPPVSIRAANDRSLVARLEVPTDAGVRRVLLTGDIQRSAMLMLLADDEPDAPDGLLDAEITELAHHGSHHAVAETFLEAIGPSAVLQSTGPSRLGDRRWNTTRRALDAWWGITARDGALWAEIKRDGGIETGSVRDD